MKIKEFIKNTILEYLAVPNNQSEYKGEHSAPGKDDDVVDPMYNVVNMFPDMYTTNALKYYGGYGLDDHLVINQIQSVHNKKNRLVTIYRAVPDLNKDIDKKIKNLRDIIYYKDKHGFFPMKNQTVNDLELDVYDKNPSILYNDAQKQIYDKINKIVDDLIAKKEKPFKINNGDWVTISKLYAKQHGVSNLNNKYKILTKTVPASQVYTDGNSIFEWGYSV